MNKIAKCLLGIVCFVQCAVAASVSSVPINPDGRVMPLVTMDQAHHEVLREVAQPVTFPLDPMAKETISDLKKTFASLASPYGKPAGLAAPQIGISLRIIIIQIPPEAKQKRKEVFDTLPPTVFINPSYVPIKSAGQYKDWEGCYSVPNKTGEVNRYFAIKFTGYTEDGVKVQRTAKGFLARLLQHEIDHLNGTEYIDYHCSTCRFGDQEDMLKLSKAGH